MEAGHVQDQGARSSPQNWVTSTRKAVSSSPHHASTQPPHLQTSTSSVSAPVRASTLPPQLGHNEPSHQAHWQVSQEKGNSNHGNNGRHAHESTQSNDDDAAAENADGRQDQQTLEEEGNIEDLSEDSIDWDERSEESEMEDLRQLGDGRILGIYLSCIRTSACPQTVGFWSDYWMLKFANQAKHPDLKAFCTSLALVREANDMPEVPVHPPQPLREPQSARQESLPAPLTQTPQDSFLLRTTDGTSANNTAWDMLLKEMKMKWRQMQKNKRRMVRRKREEAEDVVGMVQEMVESHGQFVEDLENGLAVIRLIDDEEMSCCDTEMPLGYRRETDVPLNKLLAPSTT